MRVAGLALLLSGCAMMEPSARDTQAVEQRLGALEQRIGALEQRRYGTASPAAEGGWSETSTSASEEYAASGTASPPMRDRVGGALQKLFRGGVNLITGWVEIPKRMHETSQQSGAAAGWTWGLLRGFGHGFIRTIAGAEDALIPAAEADAMAQRVPGAALAIIPAAGHLVNLEDPQRFHAALARLLP